MGARVCRQLTCIRVGWVLLCGCSSADCGGGVDRGQLLMKLSLGAFPAALRAACAAFGGLGGAEAQGGLGVKGQVRNNREGLAFIAAFCDCKLLSELLDTFPYKGCQELLEMKTEL